MVVEYVIGIYRYKQIQNRKLEGHVTCKNCYVNSRLKLNETEYYGLSK